MNEEKKRMTKLKEWWTKCPAKPMVCALSFLLAFIVISCVHELGVAFGKFLYYAIM